MSESEAAVSGDVARLNELVRFVIEYQSAEKLLKEHKPDGAGRCRICRSIGCTLFAAAVEAKRHMTAKKLGGSAP
jgi:hypothetical protein